MRIYMQCIGLPLPLPLSLSYINAIALFYRIDYREYWPYAITAMSPRNTVQVAGFILHN